MIKTTQATYVGKICEKHPELAGLRYKNTCACIICRREAEKVYKSKKRDKISAQRANYRAANLTKVKQDLATWKSNNSERVKRYGAEWRKQNKDKRVASKLAWFDRNPGAKQKLEAEYRASKLQRTVAWANHDAIRELYARAVETNMTVDHIIPLQGELVSGLHVEYNLQLLTSIENSKKGNKFTPYLTTTPGCDILGV